MLDIRDRTNGDVVVPLPDVDGEPSLPQLTPNLVADAIENTAMAACSTTPVIHVPALRPNIAASNNRANTRRRALQATWSYSALMEMLLPRSYRQLCGYGTTALMVVPDYEDNRARITLRDPLGAYPDYRSPDDSNEPRDIGFIHPRSPKWICDNYPEAREMFMSAHERQRRSNTYAVSDFWDSPWDMVEWIDEDEMVVGILGPRHPYSASEQAEQSGMELRRWPNRAGMVPVAMPRRITLDRIEGQVTKMTGAVDMMGKLMALDVLAAEKAIFPDMVVLGNSRAPQLLNASGRWNDGRTGEANLVQADNVSLLQSAPGPLTHPVIDRLHANINASIGNSPLYEGRSQGSSLRTGAALSQMGAFSIDPRIQELQRLMTRALKVANSSIIEVEKGYFPSRRMFHFSGWAGDFGHVEYTPSEDFESSENAVTYSIAGADINQTSVAISQAQGTGLMSSRTARRKHPLIEDETSEEEQIAVEAIEAAIRDTLLMQAQQGALPLVDLAEMLDQYKKGRSWSDAVRKADEKARARQAAEAPAPEEMAPGLALPGMGAEAMPELGPAIAPPADSLQNFKQLTTALNARPMSA